MNLTEKIALDCGLKISTPEIDEFFYPLSDDNYIIIDTRSTFDSGVYDFYRDVVDLVHKYLITKKIKVFQFADENSLKLSCDKCFIKLNKKQECYLINRSKLIVANEGSTLYLASALNKESIGLYSIFTPENRAPVWNKDKQKNLESHRFNNLPSYNQLKETPKSVNLIDPYEIARNILDKLGIDHDLNKYELIYLGKNYNQRIVEVIPDFISDENFLKNQSINLRLDYIQDLDAKVLQYWLYNKKVNIITDKDMNPNLLKPYKNNIVAITIMLSDDISENFVKICKTLGLQIKIYCDNKQKFNEYKFKFLDWEVEKDFKDEELLSMLDFIDKNSKYVSSKTLISKGKQYPCKSAYLNQKELDYNGNSVTLDEDFEQEIEFFKIYNVKSNAKTSKKK